MMKRAIHEQHKNLYYPEIVVANRDLLELHIYIQGTETGNGSTKIMKFTIHL